MRILVISDSHRILDNINNLIENSGKNFGMVLHLGDCAGDINMLKNKYSGIDFLSINGNCDHGFVGKTEEVLIINNKKIWLTHGHKNGVKTAYDRISYAAEEKNADVCLFGHTHFPTLFKNNDIWFMNPGSISFPRGIGVPSYGVLEISEQGAIDCRIVGVFGGGVYRPIDV